ncbi:MAG TPA: hypothetical protein VHM90_11400 [Phycisphaerae bacterium]|nr:hypothetical protein [Phycisphaerae bacterium]
MKRYLLMAAIVCGAVPVGAQTTPAVPMPAAASSGPAVQVGPVLPPKPLSEDARATLQVLHDRKDTLKDFTGKIDFDVEDGRSGDHNGKLGTVDFIMDPTKGPTFSAKFDAQRKGKDKARGTTYVAYNLWYVFDGRDFTIKDFGINDNTKQYLHDTLLPPGAKPGSAATLSGAMPLPIGLDVEDVARNFDVTAMPSANADEAVVKLVPRDKQKFKYEELAITRDKKQQLPVKLVQVGADGDTTTILLKELKVNTGEAKLADAGTPAAEGWRPMQATNGGGAPGNLQPAPAVAPARPAGG